VLDNVFAQTLSMSSLVYLLVCSPSPHIPYISSPNQCLLFATHAHTIATCFAVVPRLYHLFLVFLWTSYLELCLLRYHYTNVSSYSRDSLLVCCANIPCRGHWESVCVQGHWSSLICWYIRLQLTLVLHLPVCQRWFTPVMQPSSPPPPDHR